MPHEPLAPVVDLLQRIPLSARVILDVSCGRGDLLGAYALMNPTARLLGIEQNAEAAAVARQRLHEVAEVDVEAHPMPFDLRSGVDCVIYATALEHLRDPWGLVRRHTELLNPDGTMLLFVPNVEHWSFASRLLQGTWDYDPSGLLDRSHMRWFSAESTRRGLANAGLTLCDIHARIFDLEAAKQFVDKMRPSLTSMGIDPDAYLRRAAPLQYVWRVRREPQRRVQVIGNMLTPVGGVSHVRVLQPLQAMASDPMVRVQVVDRLDDTQPNDEEVRIFVLHRPSLTGEHGRNLLRALMDAGWLVVTEFDDHPDFLPAMRDTENLPFRGVHAVQTSTRPLADVLRRHNPEVAIFPNALMSLPPVMNFTDPNSVTLFFGALNREDDWGVLMPAINAVAAKMGGRLKFQVLHDQGFFDALETEHKTFTPICDYPTYMRILGQSEISFMPLGDTPFNRAKSDLKFIEAGACRVATLASTVVYGASVQDGRTGLLFANPEEFQDRLTRLVAMPELAREIGDAARRYVTEQRMLAYQVGPRIAWYRSLWARRDILTAALRERMASMPDPAQS